jgi:hypothetical protein
MSTNGDDLVQEEARRMQRTTRTKRPTHKRKKKLTHTEEEAKEARAQQRATRTKKPTQKKKRIEAQEEEEGEEGELTEEEMEEEKVVTKRKRPRAAGKAECDAALREKAKTMTRDELEILAVRQMKHREWNKACEQKYNRSEKKKSNNRRYYARQKLKLEAQEKKDMVELASALSNPVS